MTPDEQREVERIEELMTGTQPISISTVRRWMDFSSLEVRGVVASLISEHSRRVDPALSIQEICDFYLKYYEGCLIQNLRSHYVPSRYIAGGELANWFKALWHDGSVPREYLIQLKTMLKEMYERNEHLRDALLNGVLEHLFEEEDIQGFFADWKSNPILAQAFALAKEWGDDHLKR